MNLSNKNTCFIYKNDLKFNDKINLEDSEFDSDSVKIIYNNFKNKPKIELRLEDCKIENYKYLDFSKLDINNEYLLKLFDLEKIKKILERIEFLDLSHNKLTILPNLDKYSNIIYLNISFNNIEEDICDNNLIELTCDNNKIKSIKSNKLTHLNASNNNITSINVPNIKILILNYNKLNWIQSYLNLTYLECINNEINNIDNMINLEELYIGNNNIRNISNMPKLQILNCIINPLDKIKYFPNLKMLMSSTSKVSSQYVVINISKIKSDFIINFNV
jgi:protein phosphatase 1 regulatory subunit 7